MTCHWRYNLTYERYLTPKKLAEPLYLGGMFHKLLEYLYAEVASPNPGYKRRTRSKIRSKFKRLGAEGDQLETMVDYAMRYLAHIKRHSKQEPKDVIATEFPFTVPLLDIPATGVVNFIGIIDLIVERRGRVEIWDHKLQANHPRTNELNHPSISYPQMGVYAWASRPLGRFIGRSVLNVYGKRRKDNNVQRYRLRVTVKEADMWGRWAKDKVAEMLTNPDRSKSLGTFACGNCDFRYACIQHQTSGDVGLEAALRHQYEKKSFDYRRRTKWKPAFPPAMLKKMKGLKT
jgi:hypothetical protein